MKRIDAFDRLRVVALGMILACHFIRGITSSRVDLALGAVGNLIFFGLSGWCLGLSWLKKGCPKLSKAWLIHRVCRLAIPLWVFSVPYFIYLKQSGYNLTTKDVVLNLCLLNWFGRLPGLTAYWFVTAILVFYVLLFFLSKVPDLCNHRKQIICIGFGVTIFLQLLLMILGIRQGYLFCLFVLAMWLFLFADEALMVIRRFSKQWFFLSLGSIALFVLLWQCFSNDFIQKGTSLAYWVSLPVAVFLSMSVLSLPNPCREVANRGGYCTFK